MHLSDGTQQAIQKLQKGKTHLTLTLGTLKDGHTQTVSWDAGGKAFDGDALLYEIGSITKTFTASLLAQKIAQGQLALEAPLNTTIPQLPQGYYPSLRRLAVHASGYAANTPFSVLQTLKMLLGANTPKGLLHQNPYHGRLDEQELLGVLKAVRLQDRDYPFAYNNFGYGVLGYILGRVAGSSYWQAMQAYIQEDVGLPNTRLGPAGVPTGYDKKNRPTGNWQWDERDQVAAAGALSSNVRDLLRYAAYQLAPENTYLQLTHTAQGQGNRQWKMGLGWRLDRVRPYIWHDGNAGGYSCFIGFCKQQNAAAVVLSNYGLVKLKELGFLLLDDAAQG